MTFCHETKKEMQQLVHLFLQLSSLIYRRYKTFVGHTAAQSPQELHFV